jgi:hypothetical protein
LDYESISKLEIIGEDRNRVMTNAIKGGASSAPLKHSSDDQLSQVQLGSAYPLDDEAERKISMARLSYPPRPVERFFTDGAEKKRALQNSSIDLAFGCDKSGKTWQSDIKEKLAGCLAAEAGPRQRPQACDGTYLRKSAVPLPGPSIDDEDLSGGIDKSSITETKASFSAPSEKGTIELAKSFAPTLGKDLQASHFEIANGQRKTCGGWKAAQKEEMALNATQKYAAERPTAFEHLSKELRQSSLFIGKDEVDYSSAASRRLQRTKSVPGMGRYAYYGMFTVGR